MTTAQSNIEERVSRLEGEYGHLATKADVESLRGDVRAEVADLRGELRGLKWTLGVAIGAMAVGLAVLQVVLKYVA